MVQFAEKYAGYFVNGDPSWIIGGEIKKDPLIALKLSGCKMDVSPPSKFVKAMRTITASDVPWGLVMPEHFRDAFYSKKQKEIETKLAMTDLSYFEIFKGHVDFLNSLQRAKIHKKRYEYLCNMDIQGLNEEVIKSFNPVFGYAEKVEYDLLKTISGRMIVKKGPEILRLNKGFKKIIKSRYKGGKIVEIDFSSLEPRVALLNAGKDYSGQIYERINEELFSNELKREMAKEAVLATLYGSGPKSLSENTGLDFEMCRYRVLPELKKYFDVHKKTKDLKQELNNKKFIKNFFGRAIYPRDNSAHKLYNHYVQSSAVDMALLGFREIKSILDEKIKILFIIHDAAILDVPDYLVDEVMLLDKIKIPNIEGTFHVSADII